MQLLKAVIALAIDVVPGKVPAPFAEREVESVGMVDGHAAVVSKIPAEMVDDVPVNLYDIDVLDFRLEQAGAYETAKTEAGFQHTSAGRKDGAHMPADFPVTVVHDCVAAIAVAIDHVQTVGAYIEEECVAFVQSCVGLTRR